MAIWDTIKGQLRSVIEWESPSSDVLFQAWSENGDEIKNSSKLIVKPGQGVIFVHEGRIEGVHLEEGLFDLKTSNTPFVTTLSKFMQSFESEHKVGIYYFWQTEFLNQKWGTPTPVKYDDPVYKFPVSLKAHGNFSFKITKPEQFFVNVIGSKLEYTVHEAKTVLVDRFTQQMADLLAESGFSYAEIDKNRIELATALSTKLSPDFEQLGFSMQDFRIEGTDFDEATVERISRIADITAEAIAAEKAGIDYTKMQQLEALRDAAKNEGGIAGIGAGLGAGVGLGQAMMGGQNIPGATSPTQPVTQHVTTQPSIEERLKKLASLKDGGLISEAEYESKRQEILAEI